MDETVDGANQDPVSKFLASPAHHYDEDVENVANQNEVAGTAPSKRGLKRRFLNFMFEKQPSGYSSISPRKPDGTRTKIFFFNGGGRGR